jgi:hypothetical protein
LDGNSDDLAVFSGESGWQNGYGYFDGKFWWSVFFFGLGN